jgi:putative pyoverdin transport system ATP-binding/permease protein
LLIFNDILTNKVELFDFLKKKSGFMPDNILLTGTIGGLANTMILVGISTAVFNIYSGKSNTQIFLIFILLLILMIVTQRVLYHRWVIKMELAVEQTRNDLCEKLASNKLKTIENLNKGEVYNRLTQELSNISQFGVFIVKGIQAVFVVLFTCLYILQVFAPALLIIGGSICIAALIYLAIIKQVYSKYEELNGKEIDYFNWLNDILYGGKEIKLNTMRQRHISSAGDQLSEELKSERLKIGLLYNKSVIFTNAFCYFLFGIVALIMPLLFQINAGTLFVLVTLTIFLTEPIAHIVSSVPLFQKAAVSIGFISQLEKILDETREKESTDLYKTQSFNKIEIKDVKYRYTIEENEFILGPVNMEINEGEVIFLTGGNGCGKTTLVKLLTLLYTPEEGEILIDGKNVIDISDNYRKMFACIFSDFHLFEKAYGINKSSFPFINKLLKQFNLHNRVSLQGSSFSTLKLSTGQKKRLAMVVALAEEKPIYVFDEWAAEQDPEYRDYFYYDLLKELKEHNKTVVVVSHDERYFDVADKIIRMEYGLIKSVVNNDLLEQKCVF